MDVAKAHFGLGRYKSQRSVHFGLKSLGQLLGVII